MGLYRVHYLMGMFAVLHNIFFFGGGGRGVCSQASCLSSLGREQALGILLFIYFCFISSDQ